MLGARPSGHPKRTMAAPPDAEGAPADKADATEALADRLLPLFGAVVRRLEAEDESADGGSGACVADVPAANGALLSVPVPQLWSGLSLTLARQSREPLAQLLCAEPTLLALAVTHLADDREAVVVEAAAVLATTLRALGYRFWWHPATEAALSAGSRGLIEALCQAYRMPRVGDAAQRALLGVVEPALSSMAAFTPAEYGAAVGDAVDFLADAAVEPYAGGGKAVRYAAGAGGGGGGGGAAAAAAARSAGTVPQAARLVFLRVILDAYRRTAPRPPLADAQRIADGMVTILRQRIVPDEAYELLRVMAVTDAHAVVRAVAGERSTRLLATLPPVFAAAGDDAGEAGGLASMPPTPEAARRGGAGDSPSSSATDIVDLVDDIEEFGEDGADGADGGDGVVAALTANVGFWQGVQARSHFVRYLAMQTPPSDAREAEALLDAFRVVAHLDPPDADADDGGDGGAPGYREAITLLETLVSAVLACLDEGFKAVAAEVTARPRAKDATGAAGALRGPPAWRALLPQHLAPLLCSTHKGVKQVALQLAMKLFPTAPGSGCGVVLQTQTFRLSELVGRVAAAAPADVSVGYLLSVRQCEVLGFRLAFRTVLPVLGLLNALLGAGHSAVLVDAPAIPSDLVAVVRDIFANWATREQDPSFLEVLARVVGELPRLWPLLITAGGGSSPLVTAPSSAHVTPAHRVAKRPRLSLAGSTPGGGGAGTSLPSPSADDIFQLHNYLLSESLRLRDCESLVVRRKWQTMLTTLVRRFGASTAVAAGVAEWANTPLQAITPEQKAELRAAFATASDAPSAEVRALVTSRTPSPAAAMADTPGPHFFKPTPIQAPPSAARTPVIDLMDEPDGGAAGAPPAARSARRPPRPSPARVPVTPTPAPVDVDADDGVDVDLTVAPPLASGSRKLLSSVLTARELAPRGASPLPSAAQSLLGTLLESREGGPSGAASKRRVPGITGAPARASKAVGPARSRTAPRVTAFDFGDDDIEEEEKDGDGTGDEVDLVDALPVQTPVVHSLVDEESSSSSDENVDETPPQTAPVFAPKVPTRRRPTAAAAAAAAAATAPRRLSLSHPFGTTKSRPPSTPFGHMPSLSAAAFGSTRGASTAPISGGGGGGGARGAGAGGRKLPTRHPKNRLDMPTRPTAPPPAVAARMAAPRGPSKLELARAEHQARKRLIAEPSAADDDDANRTTRVVSHMAAVEDMVRHRVMFDESGSRGAHRPRTVVRRKAMRMKTVEDLHRQIVAWDVDDLVANPSRLGNDTPAYASGVPPTDYPTPQAYVDYWEPLVVDEARASLLKGLEAEATAAANCPFANRPVTSVNMPALNGRTTPNKQLDVTSASGRPAQSGSDYACRAPFVVAVPPERRGHFLSLVLRYAGAGQLRPSGRAASRLADTSASTLRSTDACLLFVPQRRRAGNGGGGAPADGAVEKRLLAVVESVQFTGRGAFVAVRTSLPAGVDAPSTGRALRVSRLESLVTLHRQYTALALTSTIRPSLRIPLLDPAAGAAEGFGTVVCTDGVDHRPFDMASGTGERVVARLVGIGRLNPSQASAVRAVGRSVLAPKTPAGGGVSPTSARDGFTLIQGPPGTGKTSTIIALLSALLADKLSGDAANAHIPGRPLGGGEARRGAARVLVCAPSNAAVDEILARVSSGGLYLPDGGVAVPRILRIGAGGSNDAAKAVSLSELLRSSRAGEAAEDGGDSSSAGGGGGGANMRGAAGSRHESDVRAREERDRLRGEVRRLSSEVGTIDRQRRQLRADDDAARRGGGKPAAPAPAVAGAAAAGPAKPPTDTERAAEFEREYRRLTAVLTKLHEEKQAAGRALTRASAVVADAEREEQRLSIARKQRLVTNASIVFSTLSAAASEELSVAGAAAPFDALIVDEAAQAVEPDVLIPMVGAVSVCASVGAATSSADADSATTGAYGGGAGGGGRGLGSTGVAAAPSGPTGAAPRLGRVVLVGDPQQLPATVLAQSGRPAEAFARSLFERLQSARPESVHMLRTQYRMHPALSAFPSAHFYGGRLANAPMVQAPGYTRIFHGDAHRRFGPLTMLDTGGGRDGGGGGGEQRQSGGSVNNPFEARVVVAVLETLVLVVDRAELTGQIVVLSPYKSQVGLLRREVERSWALSGLGVDVSTIDGVQGRETGIVVLSTVRGGGGGGGGGIGFVADQRRLNVAVTRAKYSLIVVGDASRLATRSPAWSRQVQCVREMGRLASVSEQSLGALFPERAAASRGRPVARIEATAVAAARERAVALAATPLPVVDAIAEQENRPLPSAPPRGASGDGDKSAPLRGAAYPVAGDGGGAAGGRRSPASPTVGDVPPQGVGADAMDIEPVPAVATGTTFSAQPGAEAMDVDDHPPVEAAPSPHLSAGRRLASPPADSMDVDKAPPLAPSPPARPLPAKLRSVAARGDVYASLLDDGSSREASSTTAPPCGRRDVARPLPPAATAAAAARQRDAAADRRRAIADAVGPTRGGGGGARPAAAPPVRCPTVAAVGPRPSTTAAAAAAAAASAPVPRAPARPGLLLPAAAAAGGGGRRPSPPQPAQSPRAPASSPRPPARPGLLLPMATAAGGARPLPSPPPPPPPRPTASPTRRGRHEEAPPPLTRDPRRGRDERERAPRQRDEPLREWEARASAPSSRAPRERDLRGGDPRERHSSARDVGQRDDRGRDRDRDRDRRGDRERGRDERSRDRHVGTAAPSSRDPRLAARPRSEAPTAAAAAVAATRRVPAVPPPPLPLATAGGRSAADGAPRPAARRGGGAGGGGGGRGRGGFDLRSVLSSVGRTSAAYASATRRDDRPAPP
ncbi:hypothetical protein BU14_0031s0139 [Porphyra umbilicalis]|uniref:AAA+ ATPase domain-containing protein n=1 Tax=Porphyra umbilicalis TaxID=2786 RepID=A0A1X6PJE4_PORUM|nr:hypothetical protein BU14_0031s0139 [Porphyra umbilicalis]|eukprot:OSX80970.1 hypothetical protein BU14_0031s0139 [Porphyra umbilicalis]